MRKRIVIIEDDSDILDVLKTLLQDCGFCVAGSSAVNDLYALLEPMPDLILIDTWLPGNREGQLVTRLKTTKATQQVPVILTSVHPQLPMLASTCIADGYLSKPFDISQLFEVIYANIK